MSKAVVWKQPPGFPGYEVSTAGGLRSHWHPGPGGKSKVDRKQPPTPLAGTREPNGSRSVTVRTAGNVTIKIGLGRLVLMAFVAKPKPGEIVGYRDGDRSNLAAKNLFWQSKAEAAAAMQDDGVAVGVRKNLDAKTVDRIRRRHAKGVAAPGGKLSMAALGREFGISKATVSKIVRNEIHVANAA